MKRLLAFFLAMIIFCSTASAVYGEETEEAEVYSYDFDLRFFMKADVFPARERTHMQGYADLLNMLELKGNLTYNQSSKSIDLNAKIIPVTNPDAAILFRVYGIPECIGLSSPLFGNETIWFENLVLMEFTCKTWNNLRIPLQYITVLYPYATEDAFRKLSNAWTKRFGNIRKSCTVSKKDISALAKEWSSILKKDNRLKYWIYSLSLPVEKGNVMEMEFSRLPDYLLNQVTGGKTMKVTVNGSTQIWENEQKQVLFMSTEEDGSSQWILSLPATENGYVPFLSFSSATENDLYSMDLKGSYSLEGYDFAPESLSDRTGDESALPGSLLAVSLEMNNWPISWPMNASADATLMIGGILYPNAYITLHGETTENGNILLTLSQPVDENGNATEVLTCSGTVVPVSPSSVPVFSQDDFSSALAVFNVSDLTMDDFIHRIRRPLFFGILNFLNELPARACQSVMDDLENYGVLEMVLID